MSSIHNRCQNLASGPFKLDHIKPLWTQVGIGLFMVYILVKKLAVYSAKKLKQFILFNFIYFVFIFI